MLCKKKDLQWSCLAQDALSVPPEVKGVAKERLDESREGEGTARCCCDGSRKNDVSEDI